MNFYVRRKGLPGSSVQMKWHHFYMYRLHVHFKRQVHSSFFAADLAIWVGGQIAQAICPIRPRQLLTLGPEDLDKLSPVVTDRTGREVGTALQAANLVTTWSHHTVNSVIVTNDTLKEEKENKSTKER